MIYLYIYNKMTVKSYHFISNQKNVIAVFPNEPLLRASFWIGKDMGKSS